MQGAHKGRPYKAKRTESGLKPWVEASIEVLDPSSAQISGYSVFHPPAMVHSKFHIFHQIPNHGLHLGFIR